MTGGLAFFGVGRMGDLLGWEGLIVFGISGSAWKEIQRRAGMALIEADRRAWHDRITK
jgi:hypothetical protein